MTFLILPFTSDTTVFVHDEKLGQQPVNSLRTKKKFFFNVYSILIAKDSLLSSLSYEILLISFLRTEASNQLRLLAKTGSPTLLNAILRFKRSITESTTIKELCVKIVSRLRAGFA
jgi:hypothetical protein